MNWGKTKFEWKVRDFALRFWEDIQNIKDPDVLYIKRKRLQELSKKCRKNQKYVDAVIYLIKKHSNQLPKPKKAPPPYFHNNQLHKVTDHALVQYLRRAHNVDIEKLKDRIIEQNNTHNLCKPIYKNDYITTFYDK